MTGETKLTDKEQILQTEKPAVDADATVKLAQAQRLEQVAGAALVDEGEEEEVVGEAIETSPETIASKYIESIPVADREVVSPNQVDTLMLALEGTLASSHLTKTKDRLGQISPSILNKESGGGHEKTVQFAEAFAADPISATENADSKLQTFARGELPKTVQNALLAIILQEGTQSAQGAFGELARSAQQNRDKTPLQLVEEVIADPKFISEDSDNIRREALKQFLEGVYPESMGSPEAHLLGELSKINGKSIDEIAGIVEKFQNVTGIETYAGIPNALRQAEKEFDPNTVPKMTPMDRRLFSGTEDQWVQEQRIPVISEKAGLDYGVTDQMKSVLEAAVKEKIIKKDKKTKVE